MVQIVRKGVDMRVELRAMSTANEGEPEGETPGMRMVKGELCKCALVCFKLKVSKFQYMGFDGFRREFGLPFLLDENNQYG